MKAAIAIFAKTPDLSPCKTRLAAEIGTAQADAFYRLSLDAMQVLADDLAACGHDCWWTLAEPEGAEHAFWAGRPTRYAGDGGLGARLHHTYSQLLQSHDAVVLMGADAPQITADFVEQALKHLHAHDYAISPATDGGFTLFAGKVPMDESLWLNTPYSTAHTLQSLVSGLESYHLFGSFSDVDVQADLAQLLVQMPQNTNAAQQRIAAWIEENILRM